MVSYKAKTKARARLKAMVARKKGYDVSVYKKKKGYGVSVTRK